MERGRRRGGGSGGKEGDDLRRKVKKGVIGTGAMSDPYNPFEEKLCLTRHALELVDAYEFGISNMPANIPCSRSLAKA